MVLYCPECGAENSETAFSCSSCGWPLRPSTDSVAAIGADGRTPSEAELRTMVVPGQARAWRSSEKWLTVAIVLAAAAFVLVALSFVLYMYYYEKILDPDRDMEDFLNLADVSKAISYSTVFGKLFGLVAFAVVVKSVIATGAAPVAEFLRRNTLSIILWLSVLMVTLIGVATFVVVYMNEGAPDLTVEAMKVLSRLSLYPQLAVDVIMTAVLFMFAFGLRKATFATDPTRRPRP